MESGGLGRCLTMLQLVSNGSNGWRPYFPMDPMASQGPRVGLPKAATSTARVTDAINPSSQPLFIPMVYTPQLPGQMSCKDVSWDPLTFSGYLDGTFKWVNLARHNREDDSKSPLYFGCCLRLYEIYLNLHVSNFFSFTYLGLPYMSDVAHHWNPNQPISPMISHMLVAYNHHRPQLRMIPTYGNQNICPQFATSVPYMSTAVRQQSTLYISGQSSYVPSPVEMPSLVHPFSDTVCSSPRPCAHRPASRRSKSWWSMPQMSHGRTLPGVPTKGRSPSGGA